MHVGGHQAGVQLQVALEKVERQDWDNMWHLEVAQTVEEEGVRKDTHTELGVCRDFRTSLNVSRKIWVS